VPIHVLQIVIGALLLLFGVRWLRKAILRSAGVIALHDEDIAFAREAQAIRSSAGAHGPLDTLAALAAFKAVMLEGIEVIVIVVGVGAAGNTLVSASIGALAACLLVAVAGALIHRPLSRVPENTLKFIVGLLVCAFGLFWFGEGIGIVWPYEDAAIVGLFAGLLLFSRAAVDLARRTAVTARLEQTGCK
jgi:Ca2+/H+ antiporter, TMEM165/GDT1 family